MRADLSSESYLHSGRSTPQSSVALSSAAAVFSARGGVPSGAAGNARQTGEELYDEDGFLLDSTQPSRQVRPHFHPYITFAGGILCSAADRIQARQGCAGRNEL